MSCLNCVKYNKPGSYVIYIKLISGDGYLLFQSNKMLSWNINPTPIIYDNEIPYLVQNDGDYSVINILDSLNSSTLTMYKDTSFINTISKNICICENGIYLNNDIFIYGSTTNKINLNNSPPGWITFQNDMTCKIQDTNTHGTNILKVSIIRRCGGNVNVGNIGYAYCKNYAYCNVKTGLCDNCSNNSKDSICCLNGISSPDHYSCICNPGWFGDTCEIPDCTVSNCIHGKCSGKKCICDSGWQNTRCDIPINPKCKCINGSCLDDKCICYTGWSGPTCNIKTSSTCTSSNCINGKCTNNICVCNDGWIGTNCNTEIPSICNIKCVNGICNNNICTCNEGWSGTNCDIKNQNQKQNKIYPYIILSIFLLIIIIIIFYFFGIVKYKK
jgi:hypothetical protein